MLYRHLKFTLQSTFSKFFLQEAHPLKEWHSVNALIAHDAEKLYTNIASSENLPLRKIENDYNEKKELQKIHAKNWYDSLSYQGKSERDNLLRFIKNELIFQQILQKKQPFNGEIQLILAKSLKNVPSQTLTNYQFVKTLITLTNQDKPKSIPYYVDYMMTFYIYVEDMLD